jgi:hypothetical protein
VEPYLGLLQQYPNFNFIFSESPHINDHGKVTQRNTPPLLGIAYLLVEGISPHLGITRHGYEEPDADRSEISAFLNSTSLVQDVLAAPFVTAPRQHDLLPTTGVLTGRASGAVRVSIWENGKYLASVPVTPDGDWTWQRREAWRPGEHMVRLFAVDANGYQSTRTEVKFTASEHIAAPRYVAQEQAVARPRVALPPPIVHTPEPYQQILGTQVRITGASNAATQVGFRKNGVLLGLCPVAHDGRWRWDADGNWASGMHTVEVFAANAVGEESPPASVTFAVMSDPGQ